LTESNKKCADPLLTREILLDDVLETALFADDDDATAHDAHDTSRYRPAQLLTCKFMSRWLRENLSEISRREKGREKMRIIEIRDVSVVTEFNELREAWKYLRVFKGLIKKCKQSSSNLLKEHSSHHVGKLGKLDVSKE
jgi:Family of unknown function (DUF5641)